MKVRVLSIGLVIIGLACLGADKPCAQTVKAQISWIEVTGKGYPPNKEISQARKRLLAKRAAVVDAYRLMAERLGETGRQIAVDSGYRHVSGFIKGAEIKKVRYFHDGRVEVDLVMPVNL